MIISFFLPIEPVAKGRPRFTRRGICYTPKETKEYEKRIKLMLSNHRDSFKAIYDRPISLDLKFFILKPKSVKRNFPCVRPDLDNFIKGVLDAFNGEVFLDDGQIISLTAAKRYHDTPGIEVYIESK